MPKKRRPPETTEEDLEKIKKTITELKKGKVTKYPEPKDNYLILK